MTFEQIIVNSIIPVLSVLSAVWWLGRKIGDSATKDDLLQLKTELKDDMVRQEERLKADNIRVEERLTERIGRVEAKADRAIELAIANEGKLLSLTEKSDYIVRQVERIEARQYQQLTAAAIDVEEEN